MIYGNPITLGGGDGGLSPTDAILRVQAPAGSTVTISKGAVSKSDAGHEHESDPTLYDYYFIIHQSQFDSVNPWTVTATLGANTASATVIINASDEYDVSLSYLVPAEYQAVEYLERPEQSGAYFNTGIVPGATTFVELKYKCLTYTAGFPWPLGCRIASSSWWGVNISTAGNTTFYYNASSFQTGVPGYVNTDNVVQWVGGNKIRASNNDGATFTEYSKTQASTPSNPFTIFAADTNTIQKGANSMRVKRVTIGDAELVPCYRKSDSVPGFWNRRDEVFITKTGTDTITVGPDI